MTALNCSLRAVTCRHRDEEAVGAALIESARIHRAALIERCSHQQAVQREEIGHERRRHCSRREASSTAAGTTHSPRPRRSRTPNLLLAGHLAKLEALLALADRHQEVIALVQELSNSLLELEDQGSLLSDLFAWETRK